MSHHRQHAIAFLELFQSQVSGFLTKFEIFVDTLTLTDPGEIGGVDYIRVGMGRARGKAVDAIALLSDQNLSLERLFEVRQLINQPQTDIQPPVFRAAALREMSVVIEVLAGFSHHITSENAANFAQLVQMASSEWSLLDRALWHTNDANNELYYEDPDFGPQPDPSPPPPGKIVLADLLGQVIELRVTYRPVGHFDLFGRVTQTVNKKHLLVGSSTFTSDSMVSVHNGETPVKYEVELGLDSL